jgi:hypothetical protein
MAKPYDATMRKLIELGPADWLEFLGIPVPDPNQVQVIDSIVSTVTAEADKVLRRGGPQPVIVHAEILAGRDLTLPERAHWYNTQAPRSGLDGGGAAATRGGWTRADGDLRGVVPWQGPLSLVWA